MTIPQGVFNGSACKPSEPISDARRAEGIIIVDTDNRCEQAIIREIEQRRARIARRLER